MARMRNRTVYHAPHGYTGWSSRGKVSSWTEDTAVPTYIYETCTDVLHSGPPFIGHGPLDLVKQVSHPGRYTGIPYFGTAGKAKVFLYAPPWSAPLPVSPPNWDVLFTKAIANLNPNKPTTDLPLFLFEFKDFPKMLKSAGNFLKAKSIPDEAEKYADLFLSYNFGWGPLLSDLRELAFLGENTDNRIKHLRRLEEGDKFKRTLSSNLDTSSGEDWIGGGPVSNGNYPWSKTSQEEIWFVAQAQLDSPLPDAATADEWKNIQDTLNLSGVSPSTLWNMIPWSFVVDYFTNLGDFIETYQGNLRWSLGWVDVCQFGRVEKRVDLDNLHSRNPGFSYWGGRWVTTSKRRQSRYKPTPQIRFTPFLNGKQLANLGALTMTQKWKS